MQVTEVSQQKSIVAALGDMEIQVI
jgi:hypothetical protein